jgi:hypothetical protein
MSALADSHLSRVPLRADAAPSPAATALSARSIEWISEQGMLTRIAELEAIKPPTDGDKALSQLLQSLGSRGLRREWVLPPFPQAVLALKSEFPNFAAVIDSVAGQVALLRTASARPGPLAPLLLLGSPGVGKTTFATRLARVLGVHSRVLPVSAMSAGFTLAGLDRGWANGRPGEVFQAIARSGQANHHEPDGAPRMMEETVGCAGQRG